MNLSSFFLQTGAGFAADGVLMNAFQHYMNCRNENFGTFFFFKLLILFAGYNYEAFFSKTFSYISESLARLAYDRSIEGRNLAATYSSSDGRHTVGGCSGAHIGSSYGMQYPSAQSQYSSPYNSNSYGQHVPYAPVHSSIPTPIQYNMPGHSSQRHTEVNRISSILFLQRFF